jgi:hypothetical protein
VILTAEKLNEEATNARERLKHRVADMRRIVEGMAGRASSRDDGTYQRLVENHYHQFTSLVVPRMVSGDPRVKIRTPRGGEAKAKALAGELGVNEWIRQTQHRTLAQRLATDCCLGWGAAVLHLERRTSFDDDDDDPVAWPILTRLDQGDAWWDPLATSWQRKAFAGYHYATTVDDLLIRAGTEKGWNRAAIRALPLDAGIEDLDRPHDAPHRGEVVVREMWTPYRLPNAPKNTNGTIFTMSHASGVFLREPMPFFGPPWGPIYLYDVYYVPGQALGMAPCGAVMAQVEELNEQARRLSTSIAKRKKVLLGKKASEQDNATLNALFDGGHALFDHFDNNTFEEFEYGGPSAEQIQNVEILRNILDRASGLDDAGRGATPSDVTATAVATANASTGVRTGYIAQRFADCDEQALRGVLWYLCHSRALKIYVDPDQMGADEAMQERGIDPAQVEVAIRGGEDEGMSFDDYHLTLDRYSMERVSEGLMQQRALQWVQAKLNLYSVAPQISSFADVGLLDKTLDEAFNRDSGGNMIDAQKAADYATRQEQLAQQAEQPEQGMEAEAPDASAGMVANVA